ncbi:MAG: hypothetical protein ACM3TR_10260 [Caulobacteraceae bacterium]
MINTWEDIPQCFQAQCKSALGEISAFPYIIYLPAYTWGNRTTNELLVCLSNNDLIIFEKLEKDIRAKDYNLNDIIYVNRGTMLLYSWIRIFGYEKNCITSLVIEFNTAAKQIFEKLLRTIRSKIGKFEALTDEYSLSKELSKFDYLTSVDYKFMNYARESIIPTENVETILLQPAIYKKYFKYLKKTLCSAHMHILTDKELIIISEDDPGMKAYRTKNTCLHGPLFH